MEWYRDFDFIFEQFERGNELMNETVFYFVGCFEGTLS